MIQRTEYSDTMLDDIIKAGILSVTEIGSDEPVDRRYLYARFLETFIDQAMKEGIIVSRDGDAITSENICCDVGDCEECPECGHCELSDGYGGNDCPDCGEAMRVRIR